MDTRLYELTTRSVLGRNAEKHVVADTEIAAFLTSHAEDRISGCPIMEQLQMLTSPERKINRLKLRIALLRKDRADIKAEDGPYRAVDQQIADLKFKIAHLRVIADLANGISDETASRHGGYGSDEFVHYLKSPTVRRFLKKYAKSPTGDIGYSFELYLSQLAKNTDRHWNLTTFL